MSSLKIHFVYKLITNLVRIPIQFLLQSIYPRLLGPELYGNFDFLSDTSNKIINFIDSGLSIAFYTKLSQDARDKKLVKFYSFILVLISFIYLVLVFISLTNNIYSKIWPDQEFIYVLFSSIFAIITFFSNSILKMVDAAELTLFGEKVKIFQLLLSLGFFFIIFISISKIDLTLFYEIQILLLGLLILGNIYILNKNGIDFFPKVHLTQIDISRYFNFFWSYSSPLMLTGIFSLIVGFGERWILQFYSGSKQQAYFALSYKISSFVFIFTGAMMPLFMREVSKYFTSNDKLLISQFFLKNVKILYFLVCAMATIVSINSELITYILGGNQYLGANFVVLLMSFYPIHQTIGQINGTLFLSTNRTREYTLISIYFTPLVLFFSFYFVGPIKYYGLNLGATGLAIEMLIVQFIAQNYLLYINCRYLNLSYYRLLAFQILILLCMLSLAFLLKFIIYNLLKNFIFAGICHSILFLLILSIYIFFKPSILGIDLSLYKSNLLKYIR